MLQSNSAFALHRDSVYQYSSIEDVSTYQYHDVDPQRIDEWYKYLYALYSLINNRGYYASEYV